MSEGYPIVRRFVIRRHPVSFDGRFPWAIRDRTRPAWLGHAPTLTRAIQMVDEKLAAERGIPTQREIREAMGAKS